MTGIRALHPAPLAIRPSVALRIPVLLVSLVALCAVLLAPVNAFAVADNSGCLACHADDQVMTVDPVDRDVVCKSCHLDFAGAHPYHQSGANCGAACHRGWGAASPSATPIVTDAVAGASFATTGSIDVPASVLHVIHSTPSWPASVSGGPLADACASCHAVASCKACHTGVIPATHGNHSATGNALVAPQAPWSGTMGRGVLLADQTMKTAVAGPNQCGATGCHDLVATQAGKPRITEDYNYALGGNAADPTGTNTAISTVGTWRARFATSYSAGRMSYSNSAVTSLTATVSGDRFEIISERDPYRGTARVLLDGVQIGTFDSYAPLTTRQAVVFSSALSGGTHTVCVVPTGLMNASARAAFVVVDGIKVYPAQRESTTPECISCHNTMLTHGADHNADPNYAAPVLRPPSGPYYTIKCLSCHRTNLLANHGSDYNNCAMCHLPGGPRSSFGVWDKTCQTGACHPGSEAPHPASTIQHYHNLVAPGYNPDPVCYGCHGGAGPENFQCGTAVGCHTNVVPPATTVDFRPPTTVVTRIAEEPITWKLLATDVGDGVVATYYSFDGGPFLLYTAADHENGFVNPADGQAPFLHTLRYYSVDAAGNIEAIQTEDYDVLDDTPPVVTFNGVDGGPIAKSLVMTVTDPKVNGLNTGVASVTMETVVFYRWWNNWVGNGGVMPSWVTMGNSASYPNDATWDDPRVFTNIQAVASGWHSPTTWIQQLATSGNVVMFYIRYTATDYAGNQTGPTQVLIQIDNGGPVTTTAAAGTYRWKLNATDTAAGVATTYYSFDGAPFVVYTAADHTAGIVNTQPGGNNPGAHVLNYYSVDKLGNTETTKTLDYTIP